MNGYSTIVESKNACNRFKILIHVKSLLVVAIKIRSMNQKGEQLRLTKKYTENVLK